MLDRLFPRQIDNAFRGPWIALALFALVVFVKGAQAVVSIVDTHRVATTADGISLDGLNAAQVQTVLSLFAALGWYVLLLPLLSLIVLIRYRAMIPLMYLMLLVMQLGIRALHAFHPAFAETGASGQPTGFYVNLGILAVTLIGFALSLRDRSGAQTGAGT